MLVNIPARSHEDVKSDRTIRMMNVKISTEMIGLIATAQVTCPIFVSRRLRMGYIAIRNG